MNSRLCSLILAGAMVVAGGGLAAAQSDAGTNGAGNESVGNLLNRATQINLEEEHIANLTKDKAGDNQALATFAETIHADHAANQDAVQALAAQLNIKLNTSPSQTAKSTEQDLSNLKGAEFNSALLNDEIKDHQQAIAQFRDAHQEFKGDRNVETYIDQTIPVLQAHLHMAENLKAMASAGSTENPSNNAH